MNAISYIPRDTFIHRLDARVKLAGLLVILVLALIYTNPLYILGLLLFVLFLWYSARLPTDYLKGLFKFFLGISALIFILQVLFYPGETVLFRLSGPVEFIGFTGFITLEGVLLGTALVIRLIVIMVVAPLLVMTTPIPDIMLALVKIKVPYRYAFVLTTAITLLPSIQSKAYLIQQAQLARGVSAFDSSNLIVRLRASASVLVPMILGTFRESHTLEVAMSSRAFGAPIKRTFLLETHLQRNDYIVLICLAILLVTGILLRLFNLGTVI